MLGHRLGSSDRQRISPNIVPNQARRQQTPVLRAFVVGRVFFWRPICSRIQQYRASICLGHTLGTKRHSFARLFLETRLVRSISFGRRSLQPSNIDTTEQNPGQRRWTQARQTSIDMDRPMYQTVRGPQSSHGNLASHEQPQSSCVAPPDPVLFETGAGISSIDIHPDGRLDVEFPGGLDGASRVRAKVQQDYDVGIQSSVMSCRERDTAKGFTSAYTDRTMSDIGETGGYVVPSMQQQSTMESGLYPSFDVSRDMFPTSREPHRGQPSHEDPWSQWNTRGRENTTWMKEPRIQAKGYLGDISSKQTLTDTTGDVSQEASSGILYPGQLSSSASSMRDMVDTRTGYGSSQPTEDFVGDPTPQNAVLYACLIFEAPGGSPMLDGKDKMTTNMPLPIGATRNATGEQRLHPGHPASSLDAASPGPSITSAASSSTILECFFKGCPAKFTGEYQKGNRARHVRLKHTEGGKTYQCEGGCGKKFNRQDARLKHHRREHSHLASPAVRRI
ncbi:hypothetical protein P280DRAFT_529752 [Massarina eburnea CBS 473.64]|uniref:C2H2-type domain-containing protein n=1 Tax=Massarina eburnea CBS 473.64 TaxID=1395130 RepID=A0A6A6RVN4_9PLEO|nr:hypothetical protein P280DRAFT_529752 [Massarina eburnea CBS 473.64]